MNFVNIEQTKIDSYFVNFELVVILLIPNKPRQMVILLTLNKLRLLVKLSIDITL